MSTGSGPSGRVDVNSELSLLVDMVPSHLWRLNPDGEPVFFNKRMVDFLGIDVHGIERPGMTRLAAMIASSIHPDDAVAFGDTLRSCLTTGSRFAMRYRLRRHDGAYRWMSTCSEPLRDESGRIVQWYGLCHDVHDQVQAEEARRQSEQALRYRERELTHLVDMVPSFLWRLTPEGEPSFYNKRLIEYFGLGVAGPETPGMSRMAATIAAAVHPEDAANVEQALHHSIATGERFSHKYRLRRADGTYRWMSGRAEPLRGEDGQILQWYGLAHDIDDLVTAQDALRHSERQLRQMIDALPVRAFSTTPTGKRVHFNKRYEDYLRSVIPDFDALEEPRISKLVQDLLHPEDAPEVQRKLQTCMETGATFVMRYRRRDGAGVYRWAEGRMEPLRDQNGVIVQWYAINLDIDDEMRAQEALRARERELSLLVDMVPSHLWRLTPEGETTLANKSMADFLGWDVTDKNQLDVVLNTMFHPDDAQLVADVLGRCLVTGEHFAMRYRLRRADGVYRWMSGRAKPMRDEAGRIVQWFGLCHDIDDQVHAEEALRRAAAKLAQASRAASLAELSASIAHEVNQPLAAIVTNSQACHRWLSATPPNIERAMTTAERITRDAKDAADVVSRIRGLFRQAPHPRTVEDVNRVIGEVCQLMADETTAKDIRVEMTLEPNLPSVALDRVQLQQVLVNLMRNGLEAMDSVLDRARALQIRSSRDGVDAIRVEVRDVGNGFEDAERVFEPFFTTKRNGMGMGLAICRSIIESHGGRLWTANNERYGALVAFTLPLPANPPEARSH